MADQTIPLLVAYIRALKRLKVPEEDQELAIIYAKTYLELVAKENGRLNFTELRTAALKTIEERLTKQGEILNEMLTDPEQSFGTINKKGRPVLHKD